jgi:4-hydroxy-tetrahydrodipicolinate synthase
LVKDYPKQILGVKDSTYNLYEKLKIPNFHIFPGSETKLLKGLELGCSGIISAVSNVTANLARKVYDDFNNNKKQTFNFKLCSVRSAFDKYNLISGLHTFMAEENEKYKRILPPLSLLDKKQKKELMDNLKELNFFPQQNIAA